MQSNEAKLGTIPKGNEGRDAVHVAIVPVRAGEDLACGMSVKINGQNLAESSSVEKAIGIVDPFRPDNQRSVKSGSWFWLCLYPKTIIGLRHVWEHPAFPIEDEPKRNEHEEWIRGFAPMAGCSYDSLMNAASRLVESGDYVNRGEDESYKNATSEQWEEFWKHWSALTGKSTTENYAPFSCSC